MTQFNFDATTVEPQKPLETIPTGWYQSKIVASELKPTSAGDGQYANLEFEIMVGEHAGRKMFGRINTQNKNPQASEIGYKQLSAICHAVGILQITDLTQLHERPLMIRVVKKPAEGQYDESNDIKAYKAVEGGGIAPTKPAQPTSFAAPTLPAAGQPAPAAAPNWSQPAPAPAPAPVVQAPAPVAAPAPPAPAPAPAPAAPPVVDPLVSAKNDGWADHPSAPGWMYKGQEVLEVGKVREKYSAPTWAGPAESLQHPP